MDGPDSENVLNICLDRLRAGDNIENCLASHPSHAGQLAPLLHVARRLETSDGPFMSPQGFDAGQARLLARAAQLRDQRDKQAEPVRRVGTPGLLGGARRLVRAFVAGILLLFIVITAGTVSAASTSLPGSPLYPVKRATETLVSSVAVTPQLQARAHLAWADRRLREIEAVVARDGVADEALLAALEQETEQALVAAEQAGLGPLRAALSDTEHQQAVLSRVLDKAPAAARPGLERALEASAQGHARVQSALERATHPEPPSTPPGRAGDPTPSHGKRETPAATDVPTTPPVPSEAKDKPDPAGKGHGQDQGRGQGQAEEPHGDQDEIKEPEPDQEGEGGKAEDSNHDQGKGHSLDEEQNGPPGEGNGQGVGPPSGKGPDQGQGNEKLDKPDSPGQSNYKSK